MMRRAATAVLCGLLLLVAGAPCGAAPPDSIRVGRASPDSFLFALLDVGTDAHIWEKVGLSPVMSAFKSDAQQQQAFVAHELDFAIGSGPAMGYRSKGIPAMAVAEMYGAPANMCIIVAPNSPIKNVRDLKGKTVSVSSAGSLTDWLVHETAREQGWGPAGITSLEMGAVEPRIIAMDNGQTQGTLVDLSVGYRSEEAKEGRVLMSFGFIKHFITHAIFASDSTIADHPDVVERFLKGWFMTVAYAKTHKTETVNSAAAALHQSKAVIARLYDEELPGLSNDGTFDAQSVATVASSLKELGIMDTVPDPKTLYTSKFTPVKI
jgi:ABC-type nitrate/sulfonate/bicarbonate transport system substrate-binding protein